MAFLGMIGWEMYIFIGTIMLFFASGLIITLVLLNRYRWKFKVSILENTAGQGYMISKRDRARLISFGDGGEEIFLLKRAKKYRVGYGKRIGQNAIAWAIANDGYWYNITLGDLDKKLMEVGVMPVERDMRFATASLRKGIEDRYNKKGFMEKWGVMIAIGLIVVAIIVQGVSTYINIKQNVKVSENNLKASETSLKVLEASDKILGKVDNIQSGGSGLVPVT